MDKPSSLEEYRDSLTARLNEAAANPVTESRLAVQSGQSRWLLRLEEVSEVLPASSVTDRLVPVPLAKPWYLGLANVRGSLIGVVDFALFSGATVATSRAQGARLILIADRFQVRCGLLFERLIGLRSRERFETAEAAKALPSGSWQGALLRDRDGVLWQELDIVALASDQAFIRAGR